MFGQKKLLMLATGIATLAIATPALAIMSVPYGWYLEGNVGSTKVSDKNYGTSGSDSSSGIGGSASLGYKFMPYFAAEILYSRYTNTSIKDNSTDTKAATDKLDAYTFALKGLVPVTDTGFEIFAKLGVGRANSKISIDNATAAANIGLGSSSHSATGLYWGGGAQYYFTPEFAANAQWEQQKGSSSTGDLSLLTVGASFIFD